MTVHGKKSSKFLSLIINHLRRDRIQGRADLRVRPDFSASASAAQRATAGLRLGPLACPDVLEAPAPCSLLPAPCSFAHSSFSQILSPFPRLSRYSVTKWRFLTTSAGLSRCLPAPRRSAAVSVGSAAALRHERVAGTPRSHPCSHAATGPVDTVALR